MTDKEKQELKRQMSRLERCRGCEYVRTYYAQDDWRFPGCTHSPYSGKRVIEIEECPMGKVSGGKAK